jgi:hypothetical protein
VLVSQSQSLLSYQFQVTLTFPAQAYSSFFLLNQLLDRPNKRRYPGHPSSCGSLRSPCPVPRHSEICHPHTTDNLTGVLCTGRSSCVRATAKNQPSNHQRMHDHFQVPTARPYMDIMLVDLKPGAISVHIFSQRYS